MLHALAWAAALPTCLLAWVSGTLLVAAVLPGPALFLGGGTVAAVAVGLRACRLSLRGRRVRRAAAAWLVGPLAVASLVVAVLVPLGDPVRAPATQPGAGAWRLDDGVTLAYGVVRAAEPEPGAAPVIVLHGGPGAPDTAGLLAAFGPLAEDGRDVWAYDQRGSGGSSRMADAARYTTWRAVGDLEQVRRRSGAERVVLVGHSYGAHLAAAHLAEHPGRVQRAVLLSPGALSEHGLGGHPQSWLTAQRWAVYRLLAAPWAVLAHALVHVDPAAAHAFADDTEFDARQDRLYAATLPALHCPGRTGPPLHGQGFYANTVPQSWRAPPQPDVAAAVAGADVPVLVLEGPCDYLDWASATEYLDAFPTAAWSTCAMPTTTSMSTRRRG